ncbi:MAG: M48 family metallopeptidase [Clostridiales bacterium]|nr:M48 family metallopeptidase [Clostridiales bacterium]
MAEKIINIVEKGRQWKQTDNLQINIHDIAHPVDKNLIAVLEAANINTLLCTPMEQLVEANYGTALMTGIVVDEKNFPDIYSDLKACAKTLNINIPYTVVSNGISGINAFATGTDRKPYIVISNLAAKLLTEAELKFILAHECGHIAMEHMVYHTAGSLAQIMGGFVPVIGGALSKVASFPLNCWNRCSEITADRIGLICCGDLHTSQMALLKLVGGFTDISDVEIEHYIVQSRTLRNKQVLGRLGEYFSTHPVIYKRMEALNLFADSEMYYSITKNTASSEKKLYTDAELNEKVSDLLHVF